MVSGPCVVCIVHNCDSITTIVRQNLQSAALARLGQSHEKLQAGERLETETLNPLSLHRIRLDIDDIV